MYCSLYREGGEAHLGVSTASSHGYFHSTLAFTASYALPAAMEEARQEALTLAWERQLDETETANMVAMPGRLKFLLPGNLE